MTQAANPAAGGVQAGGGGGGGGGGAGAGKRSLAKLVVLGDASVGKTALLNSYVHKKFDSRYKSTIGADFVSKDVSVDGQVVCLQLWDTAGQERYAPSMHSASAATHT